MDISFRFQVDNLQNTNNLLFDKTGKLQTMS